MLEVLTADSTWAHVYEGPKDEANETYVDCGVTFAKMPSYIALLKVNNLLGLC